jgi:3-oxoacyl-[acyl-carrier-protein] synthase II
VVITGMALTSPIGNSLDEVSKSLRENRAGVVRMEGWDAIANLSTRLGAVSHVDLSELPKKKTRTMGRVALLATWATQRAIADAGIDQETLSGGRCGIAYGSTEGSMPAMEDFVTKLFLNKSLLGIQSATFLKFMSHTCAANLASYFSIQGRVLTTCSACVSSAQAIGYGYEAIKYGLQDVMVVGGAEEMHVANAAVFDIMFATSKRYNDHPERAPRPFDADRDGLVVGEGAGTFILESYERAKARGARIYAEVLGFATNCDGGHMTAPAVEGMTKVMQLSMKDAGVSRDQIEYVNAHATSTGVGDIAESRAMAEVLGDKVPVSSTKGFTGHTLGACGAIEAAFCVAMMRDGFLAHNRNLDKLDPECARLDYVTGAPREAKPSIVMTNNFAFAGINTSIVLKKI